MSRVIPVSRSRGAITWLLVAALLALAAAGSQSTTAATPAATDRIEAGGAAEGEATGLWIVQLADRSLATYRGGVQGLRATSPAVTGARQLDVATPASAAYLEYLEGKHAQFQNRMEAALGRSVEVQFRYLNVLNAFAAKLSAEEAAALEGLPEVRAVYRDTVRYLDTDVSQDLIRSPAIWDGDTGSGAATRGEGIIVGMIDSGVNPFHPSFAETDGDGYTHTNPYGPGNFTGVCDPAHPQHDDICNDKLIGAWNFHPSSPSARDVDGHGSHVGSTIGGNAHDASVQVGNDVHVRRIQGVAPRANVISYLVCFPSCPSASSVAAVNQGIADGTNVLNYSISGADNPWQDAVDLAFLDAFEAGIFVAASAGNAGPGASTVAKTGPWNASVAASTHKRVIANTVDVTDPPPPGELTGMAAVPGSGPAITGDIQADVRYAGIVHPGNELGCNAFPAGSFTGTLALIQRGTCTFATKVQNAANAGAIGVIVWNNVGGPPISMGGLEATAVPAVFLDLENGNDLRDFVVAENPDPVEVRINETTSLIINTGWEDIMAGFSSRGPSQFEMLAPTFTAPGVNILAAGPGASGQPDEYVFNQGTSMASPHGAGAGALLMDLHPAWSPAQIRSALASTAVTDILKEDGATPAIPFDMGSGRLDLDRAGRIGLTMNETHANFVAANPASGGDPKTLNLPAMVDRNCAGTCTWTRTVESVSDATAEYTASSSAPAGMTVTVNPSSFTIAPGGTQLLEITADVAGRPVDTWSFGDLVLETADTHDGGAAIAAVHYPVAVIPRETAQAPSIEVDPASLEQSQPAGTTRTQTLEITNAGDGTLDWSIQEAEPLAAPTARGSSAQRLKPTTVPRPSLLQRDYGAVPAAEAILDGGFEAGTPNPFWDEGSTNFGTPLCSVSLCGGPPPRTGSWHAWFGGTSAAETAFVRQNVVLAPGTAELRFWLLMGLAAGGTGSLQVSIDGTQVFEVTEADAAAYTSYTEVVVDVSAHTGGTRLVSFDGSKPSGPNINFFVDDISLASEGACDTTTDVPWLSVSPASGSTPAGETDDVTVTYDTTGLSPGSTHEAVLCVASNDPANPLVAVPVTLDVAAPLYERLVNAGGDEYTDGGDTWLADQVYVAGDWGFMRPQAPAQRTSRTIGGTAHQPLFSTARLDPRVYRFDGLPAGTYEIVLGFANLDGRAAGVRRFDVTLNGEVVLPEYDITGAVGNFHADEHTFVRSITGGVLEIGFDAHRAPPLVNAIAVRQLSP